MPAAALRSPILLIGDIHGKINKYHNLIQKQKPERSIQLGDFGFEHEHEWFLRTMDCTKHSILFGNHDDYTFLNREHSLGDYAVLHDGEIMAIRGGDSIDKAYRTIGVDWWPQEEMSFATWNKCIDTYNVTKPLIVLSHECPTEALQELFGIYSPSTTAKGLQAVFEINSPVMWVFGHHHKSMRRVIDGTEFICLAEGESLWV